MTSQTETTQLKAVDQYVSVALFIMLYNVVLAFEFVDKIVK